MRNTTQISVSGIALSRLTSQFGRVAFLNTNKKSHALLAVGEISALHLPQTYSAQPYRALRQYLSELQDWAFGFLSYEMKDFNHSRLHSHNEDPMSWPLLHFFQPEWIVEISEGEGTVHYFEDRNSAERMRAFAACFTADEELEALPEVSFAPLVDKEHYIAKVEAIQREIQWGNIYELNYCIPFDAHCPTIDTVALYNRLNQLTQAPFSVYYSSEDLVLMCASPERYLKKTGRRLLAQPIKGTARRGSASEDEQLREALRNNPKERAENIMITDLVRNDLSRVAERKSVEVEELCGIYTFETVHQMISSIGADLRKDCDGIDALEATFPMGSMTGAPKISAMQFIEQFETRRRGLYSGAFGYFKPDGDFDFNVVIRSLTYRPSKGLLTFQVGSAITSLSDAAQEYAECLLKADALLAATKNPAHVG